MTMLKLFLEEHEDIPWDALTYVTGHINYGGRVTDDWDRACLLAILKKYVCEDVLTESYKFSGSGLYFAPETGPLQNYRDYINGLPLNDDPEVFGMHENANITYQSQASEKIVTTILAIQPRVQISSAGMSPDDLIKEKADDLLAILPKTLLQSMGKKEMFKEIWFCNSGGGGGG